MKRSRGRGRKPSNPLNRTMESNGPDVKVRGTPHQICDKYLALARDANVAGDRIAYENYLQHAEHYHRIILASQPAGTSHQSQQQSDDAEDAEESAAEAAAGNGGGNGNSSGNNGTAEQAEQPARPARARRARRPRTPRSNGAGDENGGNDEAPASKSKAKAKDSSDSEAPAETA